MSPPLPRLDLRSLASEDWDERVKDLQYPDGGEYGVGHNVAREAVVVEGARVRRKPARSGERNSRSARSRKESLQDFPGGSYFLVSSLL